MSNVDRRIFSGTSTCLPFLLAGGQGTRLHDLTREVCKPAVPFLKAGRIVDFVMAAAARAGFDRMMVATQYRPEPLAAHLRAVWHLHFPAGLWIRDGADVQPGTGYRGTADAVRANLTAIDLQAPSEVMILSGDHVFDMDLSLMLERHRAGQSAVTVAVTPVPLENAHEFGIFSTDTTGRVTGFDEKPPRPKANPGLSGQALASMGIYIFNWDWLRACLTTTANTGADDFGHDILPVALSEQAVSLYALPKSESGQPGYWRDVGTLDAYRLAQLDFASGTPPCRLPRLASVHEAGRIVGSGSVALGGAQVPPEARLINAIIAENTLVPKGLVIGEDPASDSRWFRRTAEGTVLVTPEMVARWQDANRCFRAVA
jgi:glucose-1-phosphate adenylyltransferase